MGLEIDRERFEERDYRRFARRLEDNLAALAAVLRRPGFGKGDPSLGAELELSLVDEQARPLHRNREVLALADDPRLTVELNRFNLECNLDPTPLAGSPFTTLEEQLAGALDGLRAAAARHGGRLAAVGILPTLRPSDLELSAMTDSRRYRALSWSLRRLRHEPFRMHIDGAEPLYVTSDAVTFEGANTSLQIHLRVDPGDFAATHNAAQLATLPALAVAGNSPTFLGHHLWEETRVALFKHSVDDRGSRRPGRVARVSFGTRWLAGPADELFREGVALHEPLLPVCSDEAPLRCVDSGGTPRLEELRLHQGTVWRWNRGIYDPADGGHLRIEMRALPSGPTPIDMAANAAFAIGLTLGLAPDADAWTSSFEFDDAHHGFYRAAQHGLAAELPWPREPGARPQRAAADRLVLRLLPMARRGLERAGVDAGEVGRLLGVIEERAARGRTGAAWQRAAIGALESELGRTRALHEMLEQYLEAAATGAPVHTWPEAGPARRDRGRESDERRPQGGEPKP